VINWCLPLSNEILNTAKYPSEAVIAKKDSPSELQHCSEKFRKIGIPFGGLESYKHTGLAIYV